MYFFNDRLFSWAHKAACRFTVRHNFGTRRLDGRGGREEALVNFDRRQVSEFERQYLDNLTSISIASDTIETELYHKFNVKRGLRNADGTGVLVVAS